MANGLAECVTNNVTQYTEFVRKCSKLAVASTRCKQSLFTVKVVVPLFCAYEHPSRGSYAHYFFYASEAVNELMQMFSVDDWSRRANEISLNIKME